jgi:hypothetical protein
MDMRLPSPPNPPPGPKTEARIRFTEPIAEPSWWQQPFVSWGSKIGVIIVTLLVVRLVSGVVFAPSGGCVDAEAMKHSLNGWSAIQSDVEAATTANDWPTVTQGLKAFTSKLDALTVVLAADQDAQNKARAASADLKDAVTAIGAGDFTAVSGDILAFNADWRAFLTVAEASTVPAC